MFQFCWGKGSYLAEIQTRDEENMLDEFLIQGTTYWTGLNDLAREGRFVWAESHQETDYFNWAVGQPDEEDSDTDDCVWKAVTKDTFKGWHDSLCTNITTAWNAEVHALCEIDI